MQTRVLGPLGRLTKLVGIYLALNGALLPEVGAQNVEKHANWTQLTVSVTLGSWRFALSMQMSVYLSRVCSLLSQGYGPNK